MFKKNKISDPGKNYKGIDLLYELSKTESISYS